MAARAAERSARDDRLYIVRRPGGEGGAPPFGTREGILILLDSDPAFFE
jgi:hypothetical protein